MFFDTTDEGEETDSPPYHLPATAMEEEIME